MIEEHIILIQLTPGRAQVAYNQMSTLPAVRGSALLVRRIDQAVVAAKRYGDQLEAWARKVVGSSGEAVGFDRKADAVVVGIQTQARARLKVEEGSEAATDIQAFLGRILPRGAAGITRLPHPDAIVAEERLLGLLQGDEAAMVQRLELGGLVARLADVLPKFKAAVEKLPPTQLAFEQVRAARYDAHTRLCKVVATVYSELGEDDQEAQAAEAMAPIEHQIEALQALRASGRPYTDVDVVTRDEVPVNPSLVPSES